MEKKTLILGVAAILALGVVVAASASDFGGAGFLREGFPRGGMGREGMGRAMPLGNMTALANLGLPENASTEQISDAIWQKQLKDLGLTEDSTLREYRQALKAKAQTFEEDRLVKLRQTLNLSADATKEDIQNAMKAKWQGNDAQFPEKGRMRGFDKLGFAGNCGGK